ncbi:MAG: ribonuclease HII [Bacillota bacterium]|nr:ribonuclease HII [Bacillota bacterium]
MKSNTKQVDEQLRIENMKDFEYQAYDNGYKRIAGLDEVGRGPIAGPVTVAAVILPKDFLLAGVNDSKLVSEKKRLRLAAEIKREALEWTVVHISPAEVDRVNILEATRKAMHAAAMALFPLPDFLLIDAVQIPDIDIRQYPLIKGDQRSVSIASASIIAKVERDHLMEAYDTMFPGYGFARNKGYGTREHLQALRAKGPCKIHRRTFEPVRSLSGGYDGFQPGLFE